jgi:hypothetical protein
MGFIVTFSHLPKMKLILLQIGFGGKAQAQTYMHTHAVSKKEVGRKDSASQVLVTHICKY